MTGSCHDNRTRQSTDPKTADGPLNGIWLSRYEYVSSGRGGQTFTDLHYVVLLQYGANIQVRSLSGSNSSSLIMDLTQNGAVVTGTWSERTNPDGYYQGSVTTGLSSSWSTRPVTGFAGNGLVMAGTLT